MKKLFLIILLMFSVTAMATVKSETKDGTKGKLVRLYNESSSPVSCYYKDEQNYFTFNISAKSYSKWYTVYGKPSWVCKVVDTKK